MLLRFDNNMKINTNIKELNHDEFAMLAGTDIMVDLLRNRRAFDIYNLSASTRSLCEFLEHEAQGFFYINTERYLLMVRCEYPRDLDLADSWIQNQKNQDLDQE
jgi:hypothetical protein